MALLNMKVPAHTSDLFKGIRDVITFDLSVSFDLFGEDKLDETIDLVLPEIIDKDICFSTKY